jgi:hypothetical protein
LRRSAVLIALFVIFAILLVVGIRAEDPSFIDSIGSYL